VPGVQLCLECQNFSEKYGRGGRYAR